MNIKIKQACEKIIAIIGEIEKYDSFKKAFNSKFNKIFSDYQAGKYTYAQYSRKIKILLREKSRKDIINEYDSIIYTLLKKIETLNNIIFYEAYRSIKLGGIPSEKKSGKTILEKQIEAVEKTKEAPPEKEIKSAEIREAIVDEKRRQEIEDEILREIKKAKEFGISAAEISAPEKIETAEKISRVGKLKKIPAGKKGAAQEKEKEKEKLKILKNIARLKKIREKQERKALGAKEKLKISEKKGRKKVISDKDKTSIGFGSMGFLREFIAKLTGKEREQIISEKTSVKPSTIKLGLLKKQEEEMGSFAISETTLTEEARRIKKILEQRGKIKEYQLSVLGEFANLTIKKITYFLLNTFPEAFRKIYISLRMANIRMLSNTYVNIMVLMSIVSFILVFIITLAMAAAATPDFLLLLAKSFVMALLVSIVSALIFYNYPQLKAKERRKSINTNMPFAINHMAALSGAGINPVRVFKLISESRQYGEISVETGKVVEYTELFGYDLITAIKSVAATTPSPKFKEFLASLVTTIESGTEINNYFSQKADESLTEYDIERKKYTESVSTYSDIYLGILIAAPLFFIATLSLVSMLGGRIGGMNINVIILIGTYLIIPLLNIFFMIFLELTQPEI